MHAKRYIAIRFLKLNFATCASMFQVEEKLPFATNIGCLGGELNKEIVACRARGVFVNSG